MIIRYDWLPIGTNRPGTALSSRQGLIVHETATPEATDENESSYFHGGDRGASANVFVDWDSATWLIPLDEVSWHAGAANYTFNSMEICHTADPVKFWKAWDNAVEIARYICTTQGYGPEDVHSHAWAAETYGGDHTDPVGYFAQYGVTIEDFIAAVFSAPKPKQEEDDDMSRCRFQRDYDGHTWTNTGVGKTGKPYFVEVVASHSVPADKYPMKVYASIIEDGKPKSLKTKELKDKWDKIGWDLGLAVTPVWVTTELDAPANALIVDGRD